MMVPIRKPIAAMAACQPVRQSQPVGGVDVRLGSPGTLGFGWGKLGTDR